MHPLKFPRSTIKFLTIPALIAASMASSAALAKQDPIVLKASSKWLLDYKDEGCSLARQFGEGDQKTLIYFTRFSLGDRFGLTVGGPLFKATKNEQTADVQFGAMEQLQELEYFPGNITDDRHPAMVFRSKVSFTGLSSEQKAALKRRKSVDDLPDIQMDDARRAAITQIIFSKPLRQPVILETGSMAKPMAALSECVDNLVAGWGIDVEKHKSLTRVVEPITDPGNWVVSGDYPADMLRQGQPAIVEFRLNVSDAGQATACQIQATTRPKEFDDAVCKALIRRAKFAPALDATGAPLASYWKSRVVFEIGFNPNPRPTATRLK